MTDSRTNPYCDTCADFHEPCYGTVSIGETIPDYEFQIYHNDAVATKKFSDYKGKWLVVIFYPGDFTFVCPTELEDMAKIYSKFQGINTEVLSFSTDTVYVHKAWHDTSPAIKQVSYPMGADPSGKVADAFNVLITDSGMHYSNDEGKARRGTFVIDPKGVLRTMEIHDNSVGRKAGETLRKVQAAQYVESHPGNVCPGSWEEGGETLEPGLDLVGKI